MTLSVLEYHVRLSVRGVLLAVFTIGCGQMTVAKLVNESYNSIHIMTTRTNG